MYKYSYATINKAQNLNPRAWKPRTQLGVSLKAEQQKLEQYQGSSLWELKETAAKTYEYNTHALFRPFIAS